MMLRDALFYFRGVRHAVLLDLDHPQRGATERSVAVVRIGKRQARDGMLEQTCGHEHDSA